MREIWYGLLQIDENAKAISDKLGLTFEETQNSKSHQASRETHLAELINMENRFRTLGALAEKSGCDVCVDLPCGYTPRAIEFARKGIRFIGLDLPAAIEEGEPVIRSLMSEEENKLVTFKAVDATNYATLEAALEGADGSLCITTEGLLFYFAESEIEALCANIRRILKEHGGCWLLVDPEITLIYITILKIVCGDRFMEILLRSRERTVEKSGVDLGLNPITIRPQDVDQSMREAMAFMAKQGFKVERLPVAEHMPELVSLTKLGPKDEAAYREAMKSLAYWKVTLAPVAQELDRVHNGIQAIQSHGAVGRRYLASRAPGPARHHQLSRPAHYQLASARTHTLVDKTKGRPSGRPILCMVLGYNASIQDKKQRRTSMVSHKPGFIGAHQGARGTTSCVLPAGRRARRLRGVALLACFLCCACLVLSACGQALRSDTCTIYLYLCGSNLEAEQGIASKNIDELLKANIPSNVHVVVQTGGSTEWKSHGISANKLQRYEVSNHQLKLVDEQSNASMGESATLRDFLSWGSTNYQSDRNILILWDHGSKSADKICFDGNYKYDALDSIKIKNALAGVHLPFTYDMVIYDACYMATVENAYLLRDYAKYLVASQEMVPSSGLDYEALAVDCGSYDTEELGARICEAYYQKCESNGREATTEISFINLAQTDKLIKSLDKLCAQLVSVQQGKEGTSIIEGAANMSAQFGSKSITNVVDLKLFTDIAMSYTTEFDAGEFYKLYEAFVPYCKVGESSYNYGASMYFPVNYEKKEFDAYIALCPIKHYATLLKNIFNSSSAGITLQDKGSITSDGNFTASLTEQSHNSLLAVSFELYKQDAKDTNKYTYVGTNMNVSRNEDALSYTSNFMPLWPALNGQPLTTSVYMSLPDQAIYAAPVVVNGEDWQLLVPYQFTGDYVSGQYDDCVLWGGITENGMADKDYGSLKVGDVVATYEATDETGSTLTPRTTFTISEDSKVEDIALEDGVYGYRFVFDDVLGKDVKSNMALYEVKDGKAKLVSVLER